MTQFLIKLWSEHKDEIQVALAGGGGITGMLTLTDMVMKVTIGLLTIGFLLRKWYHYERGIKK